MININFDKLDEFIAIKKDEYTVEKEITLDSDGKVLSTIRREYPTAKELNPVRYDFAMRMIDALLDYLGEVDQSLGLEYSIDKAPITIQTYYDTLIENEIITE